MNWQDKCCITLENDWVLLRNVRVEDRHELRALARDQQIWRYTVTRGASDEEFSRYFAAMLDDNATGKRAVFVVIDKISGQVAGSMSFGNMMEHDARLEIGWSWLGALFRGKGINRWAKYLLMQYAFETLGAQRVEFKTDKLNLQARAGLRNIGATEEGILRSFNFMPDGRRRDAVFYSVLAAEWPHVKTELERLSPYL